MISAMGAEPKEATKCGTGLDDKESEGSEEIYSKSLSVL